MTAINDKFAKGRFITMDLPDANDIMAVADGDGFVTWSGQDLYINESVKTGTLGSIRTSDVGTTVGAKSHRRFRWLPWIRGAVCEVPMQGVGVLTGPMSGCWLMMYQRNGNLCVGHVGTDSNSAENTRQAKAYWNAFAARAAADIIAGFSPATGWKPNPPVQQDGMAQILGLLTPVGKLFAVLAVPQDKTKGFGHTTTYRIADIVEMKSALGSDRTYPA